MSRRTLPRLLGLAVMAVGCQQVPAAAPETEELDPASIRVAYEQRGSLYVVMADGSGHTLVRKKERRAPPADDPDVKLYDTWLDPVAQPGSVGIAVVRARNRAFNVYPGDPLEFDQSWELVLVNPAEPTKDRVLFSSRRRLDELRWSDDGQQVVGRIGRRDLLLWREGQAEVHALELPDQDSEERNLLFAEFTRDGGSVVVLMNNYLELPYLVGTAPVRPGALKVTPSFTFPSFKMPPNRRDTAPVVRLLGRGTQGSALRPPFFLTPDRRFSFYFRKREGFFPRGWIERVDGANDETFDVHTRWRGIFAK